MITSGIDHIALAVPDVAAQVDRLATAFGMVVQSRIESFALLIDPVSGLKIEISQSGDAEVHFRHLGYQAEDVDGTHDSLVESGMTTREAPHRHAFGGMYTSFLTQPGGLEIQLVQYD